MADNILMTVGGFVGTDDRYRRTEMLVSPKEIIDLIPQMLGAMGENFVSQIEDPEHPFNGWQIRTLLLQHIDDDDDDDDDDENWQDDLLGPVL